MTIAASAAPAGPRIESLDGGQDLYQPGVCNIGPEEIAARRRWGHLGTVVTVITYVALVYIDAAPIVRFVVIGLMAAGAATGYLQAYFRFCAGFAGRGVFNFGQLGNAQQVTDPAARAADKRKAAQIFILSLAIGAGIGAVAAVLPI